MAYSFEALWRKSIIRSERQRFSETKFTCHNLLSVHVETTTRCWLVGRLVFVQTTPCLLWFELVAMMIVLLDGKTAIACAVDEVG